MATTQITCCLVFDKAVLFHGHITKVIGPFSGLEQAQAFYVKEGFGKIADATIETMEAPIAGGNNERSV